MYSVPVFCVVEVVPFCQLQAAQKLQKYSIGLLDYNGLILNVIDLKELLGFEKQPYSITQKFILLKTEESMFAVVVDEINDISDINLATFQIAPNSAQSYIQSIYNKDGIAVSVINIPAIEEAIKRADETEDTVFHLPQLSDEDTEVAKARYEKIKAKNANYEAVKYYEYVKYLAFCSGNSKFCIDINYIEKVLDVSAVTLTKIPNKTNYLEGIMNFRGSFLTVINFANFIEQPADANIVYEDKKIIVLNYNDIKVGLFVDKIYEISNISNDDLIEANEFSSICPFIHNQIVKNDDIYFIIDIDNLFNDSKMYIND